MQQRRKHINRKFHVQKKTVDSSRDSLVQKKLYSLCKEFLLKIKNTLWKDKQWILLLLIFALEFFLRFYQIENRNPFGWDQVDNAWAAKNIIVNHQFPLVGMMVKQNTGFFIGPAYYYLITIVYSLTNLDPIASGIFAGITSIFTFWILFFVAKKIFSFNIALIAVFINTVAFQGIVFDRVQWPVNAIPALSLLIFYFLYKVITGNPKYVFGLSLTTGAMFHIHFTAIFFPLIIFCALPFFPRNKKTFIYGLLSLPLLLMWFIPTAIYELQNKNTNTSHLTAYINTFYHGFHLKRVEQLVGDAFIQFNPYLFFPTITIIKFFLPLIFIIIYLYKSVTKEKFLICYLILLWFVIPWFVFATYRGELSDYYFAVNRFIALIIIAYLLARLFQIHHYLPKIAVVCFLLYYGVVNIHTYFISNETPLQKRTQDVLKAIERGEVIQYQQGVPESYLYYYYMRKRGVTVYEHK